VSAGSRFGEKEKALSYLIKAKQGLFAEFFAIFAGILFLGKNRLSIKNKNQQRLVMVEY